MYTHVDAVRELPPDGVSAEMAQQTVILPVPAMFGWSAVRACWTALHGWIHSVPHGNSESVAKPKTAWCRGDIPVQPPRRPHWVGASVTRVWASVA